MTITAEQNKAGPFVGDDATTSFDCDFKMFATSDAKVVWTNTSGIESTLTEGVDYSVALNADQDTDPGATITYPLAGDPLASGTPDEKLTIEPAHAFTQGVDLKSGGGYNPQSNENALDRATILSTIIKILNNRSMLFPISDTAGLTYELPTETLRASKAIVFDASGNVTISTDDYVDQAADAAASAAAAAISVAAALVSENAAAADLVLTNADVVSAAASAAAAASSAASLQELFANSVAKTFADTPIVPLLTENGYLFMVDTSGGSVVINLSALSVYGIDIRFGFVKTTSDANTITINRGGTDTIDGAASKVISGEYEAATIVGDFSTGKWVTTTSPTELSLDITPQLSGPLDTNSQAVNTSRATVASHATTSAVWAALGNEIDLTGAETITNLPAAPRAGAMRIIHHAGAVVWTDNANISVQGDANFTAEADDIGILHALTTTTFRISFLKKDGTAVVGGVPSITDNGTEEAIVISADEEVTMPKQPHFSGALTSIQSNVTGDGTIWAATGAIWTEYIDRNADFSNGTFTAPVGGQYLATIKFDIEGLLSGHTRLQVQIVTSNRTYAMFWLNPYAMSNATIVGIPISLLFDMDAADTVHFTVAVTGGTKVIEVNGGATFSVSLLS